MSSILKPATIFATIFLVVGISFSSPTATFLRMADDLESPSPLDVIPNVTLTACGIECFKAGFDTCLGFQWKPHALDDQETNAVDTTASEDCVKPPIVGSTSYGQCGLLQCVPKPSTLTPTQGSQIYFFRGKGNFTYGSLKAPPSYLMSCTYAYRIFDKMKMTYAEAETQCQVDGARLMPVKSSDEHAFLSPKLLYDEGYWIGITDKITEGVFVASDGTEPTYWNWDAGQPNNFVKSNEDQDCVMIFRKKWNDNQCDTKLNFICQIPFLEL